MHDTKFKRKDYIYSIGDTFIDKNRDLEIVDRYEKIRIKSSTSKEYQKIYICKCNKCGALDALIEQSHLKSGRGCPVCHSKQISFGINDIPTTASWMVPYFQGGYEEAKQYTCQSNIKLYFKCPDCGEIKHNKTSINHLYKRNGFNCICKDGISYPEKFMYNFLSQANINFEIQFSDIWCKKYKYDFFLLDYNCIIETHGYQHYNVCLYNTRGAFTLSKQKEIDSIKKCLAFDNNIVSYFEIDCKISDKNYIKNSIIGSGLCKLLGINAEQINWKKCAEFATSNLVKSICIYYDRNNRKPIVEIAKKFKINSCTIVRYLKTGTELGFCNYNPQNANILKSKQVKIFNKDGSFDIYNSAKELQDISLEKYGVKLLRDDIRNVCNKRKISYKGFYFEYV